MSSELSILALSGLVVIATILLQVLLALPQVGLPYLSSPRDEAKSLTGAAGRSARCVENSVVALVLFATAVLALNAVSGFDATTLLAAQVFLLARIAYVPIYLAGIPYLRTGVWMAGFLATALLLLSAV